MAAPEGSVTVPVISPLMADVCPNTAALKSSRDANSFLILTNLLDEHAYLDVTPPISVATDRSGAIPGTLGPIERPRPASRVPRARRRARPPAKPRLHLIRIARLR